jgi:membrane protease YdiL (CAAX protease family)
MAIVEFDQKTEQQSAADDQKEVTAHLSLRAVTALEIVSVVATVLITAWAIVPMQPRERWLQSVPGLIALAMMINSHRLRGESARELGFTTRHFARAALLLLVPMMLSSAALIWIGYRAGSLNFNPRFWVNLSFIPLWGLVQQYILQGFIYRRMKFILIREQASESERIWRTRLAICATGLLFGLVHAPNLTLMALTLVGGLVWAWVYERAPNLFALGLSHGLMSNIMMCSLPAWLLESMSIGYKHFLYQKF